jgi:hypothetical protein
MAGPWLYLLSEGAGRHFNIKGKDEPVTFDSYKRLVENGRLAEDRCWRISQHQKRAKKGDELYIYFGKGNRGIIGYATIRSVLQRGLESCLDLEFDFSRCQMLIEEPIEAVVVRSWKLNLRKNPVGLSAVTSQLDSLVPWSRSIAPDEKEQNGSTYSEGNAQRNLATRYERDPRAREACIRKYGPTCNLCGFDFAAKYGKAMKGFIHVHHTKQLSSLGPNYKVDPIQDLRPLCPNCHAVVHRRRNPYSLDEVRQFLQNRP